VLDSVFVNGMAVHLHPPRKRVFFWKGLRGNWEKRKDRNLSSIHIQHTDAYTSIFSLFFIIARNGSLLQMHK
jgi:hypothetical protein